MIIVNSSYLDVSPVAVKLMFNVTQTQMRVDIGLLLVESVGDDAGWGSGWVEVDEIIAIQSRDLCPVGQFQLVR